MMTTSSLPSTSTRHSSAWPALDQASTLVDRHLEDALNRSFALTNTPGLPRPLRVPAPLSDSIRYSAMAPGKRIRPRLCLEAGKLLGAPFEAAMRAAVAVELIHCFTLIHDDLPCMDDDDFRRGRPSNHKVFGEGTALLAGDALMPIALEELTGSRKWVPAERALAATDRLLEAMGPRGVVGGQVAESTLSEKSTLEEVEAMFSAKTGALFRASLLMPMDLAGVSPSSREGSAMERFAYELGYAFQVADDLEDAVNPDKNESEKPLSICFHISADEARTRTRSRLLGAMQDLEAAFGADRAGTLVAIAREVVKSLG